MYIVFHECNVHFDKEIYERPKSRPKSYILKELMLSENPKIFVALLQF